MNNYQIFYVGTETEVAHHATPLLGEIDVKVVEPERVMEFAKPNDLAIFFSEHFHRFRKAWLQLNEAGCNTLYAVDGILEWRNAWENRDDEPACPWTMRPVLSDKVACIGASQARVLNGWGNRGKCEVVGVPRFDRFTNASQVGSTANRSDRFRVLVTTAKWPGFTDEQVAQAVRSLQDLKQTAKQLGSVNGRPIELVWRLTGQLPESLGLELDNQLNDTTGRELAEVLSEVDAVITTPSTVMLEGMLCGKPVALLDYTNSPRYVDAAWSITAADQMSAVLQELETPSARRMALQNFLLNDNLQRQELASQRMVELIQGMTRIGHDCRAAGEPVRFPANILPELSKTRQTADGFCAKSLWPNQAELVAEQSTEVNRAVAAEALRRVDHLQDRIDLLESELARAAEGFERIANHPLLAPLVKVRKVAKVMGSRVVEILRPATDQDSQETNEHQDIANGIVAPTNIENSLGAKDVVRSER